MAETFVVKLTSEEFASIGASGPGDFKEKLSDFVTKAKSMSDQSEQITALLDRVSKLENSVKAFATESRVTELVTTGATTTATTAIKAWAESDEGKKIIGAEASKITMAAIAGVGTVPVKSSPAPAGAESTEKQIEGLHKAGKHEDAFALLPASEQMLWLGGAKAYAAYFRANGRGQIGKITEKREQNLN